jgi:hypothetical protein
VEKLVYELNAFISNEHLKNITYHRRKSLNCCSYLMNAARSDQGLNLQVPVVFAELKALLTYANYFMKQSFL